MAMLLALLGVLPAVAKPMNAPTLEEAVRSSAMIVLATYDDYSSKGKIDYFHGPRARYQVDGLLARRAMLLESKDDPLEIRYDFTDGSACIAPKKFNFRKELPKKGSQWILFLQDKQSEGIITTYRGSYGRIPATPGNIAKVQTALH